VRFFLFSDLGQMTPAELDTKPFIWNAAGSCHKACKTNLSERNGKMGKEAKSLKEHCHEALGEVWLFSDFSEDRAKNEVTILLDDDAKLSLASLMRLAEVLGTTAFEITGETHSLGNCCCGGHNDTVAKLRITALGVHFPKEVAADTATTAPSPAGA
jgi:hypothetical protein